MKIKTIELGICIFTKHTVYPQLASHDRRVIKPYFNKIIKFVNMLFYI